MRLKNRAFPFWGYRQTSGSRFSIYKFVSKDSTRYNVDIEISGTAGYVYSHAWIHYPKHLSYSQSTVASMKELEYVSSRVKRTAISAIFDRKNL